MSYLADTALSAGHYRYYAGWADKIVGEVIPADGNNFRSGRGSPQGRRQGGKGGGQRRLQGER